MKRKKCKYCKSEFVAWNWIYSPFWKTWRVNFFRKWFPYFEWKFWRFLDRWKGECWNCHRMQGHFFKVKHISYEELEKGFVYLPVHTLLSEYEEIAYLIHSCPRYIAEEKHKYDKRVSITLDIIKEALEEQWRIDHS